MQQADSSRPPGARLPPPPLLSGSPSKVWSSLTALLGSAVAECTVDPKIEIEERGFGDEPSRSLRSSYVALPEAVMQFLQNQAYLV